MLHISNYSQVTIPAYCQEYKVKTPLLIDIFDHLDAIASLEEPIMWLSTLETARIAIKR
jgi:hypothetical protein